MDELSTLLIEFIASKNNPIGLFAIALSALLEYVFPPFPGDTITLFASVLITAYQWNFVAVFGAVMTGSVAGSMVAFYVGTWLNRRRQQRDAERAGPGQPQQPDPTGQAEVAEPGPPGSASGEQVQAEPEQAVIDRLMNKFRRYGSAYLVINRFLPGVRALFFVAAGMADMRPLYVLFYSAVSAALWNLGLIALGSVLGANFDTLLYWVRHYTVAMWGLIGGVIIVFMIRFIRSRGKSNK